jgi:hypothetical protein
MRSEVIMNTNLMRGALPPVRWSAVGAGVAFALAAHVCLGLFGAALGFASEAGDSRALGILAGLWALLSAFVASFLGAAVAARMAAGGDSRSALLHGALVWCVGLVAGALFLSGTLAGSAMGTSYVLNGGVIDNDGGRDTGPGSPIDSAARDAAAASLLGGLATLAGLAGAITGCAFGRQATAHTGVATRYGVTAGMMPPPAVERRTADHVDTIWSDPAFDRRSTAVPDRRQH